MIYALLRYLVFEIPSAFLRGLAFICFDKEEIIGTAFTCRRRRKPINKKAILTNYLEECRKQVQQQDNEKDRNEKK